MPENMHVDSFDTKLIAAYEKATGVSPSDIITRWFGDYDLNEIKYGVPDEVVNRRISDALAAIRMNYQEYHDSDLRFGSSSQLESTMKEYSQPSVSTQQPGFESWSEPAAIANAPENQGTPSDNIGAYSSEQESDSKYYPINEEAARRAKEANSYSDYKPGSATDEYRNNVDEAVQLAERQKVDVDPMYHEKIDQLVNTYARKLADNTNNRFIIDARMPSILITGSGNFPVRQKEKQNAARDKNIGEWRDIQELLNKIRSTGTGGIHADDPNAITKLKSKLSSLEKLQEVMKAANAYYRQHKTLDGCPQLSPEIVEKSKASMARDWRKDPKPFESFAMTNNNAEIHRLRTRIEMLEKKAVKAPEGWSFNGGNVVMNTAENRLQVLFNDKPNADVRAEMKHHGFRWAPSAGAWQRQLTDNAIYAAKQLKCIAPLPEAVAATNDVHLQDKPSPNEIISEARDVASSIQYVQAPTAGQRLFVDMDGTLAVFKPVDTMEMLYQKGYFANLTPIDNVVQAVKLIIRQRPDIDVYVLSAHLTDSKYALAEKNAWLDRNVPEIDEVHRVFPPCGQTKAAHVPGGLRETDFLLDDYTKNLSEWEPPARGIKLLNGINHTKGTWEHDRIRYDRDPQALANSIVNVMQGHVQIMDEPCGLSPVPERDFGKFSIGSHQVLGPMEKPLHTIQPRCDSLVAKPPSLSQNSEIQTFMEPSTW